MLKEIDMNDIGRIVSQSSSPKNKFKLGSVYNHLDDKKMQIQTFNGVEYI